MDPVEQLKRLAGIMPANPIAEDFETTGDANRAGSMSPLAAKFLALANDTLPFAATEGVSGLMHTAVALVMPDK